MGLSAGSMVAAGQKLGQALPKLAWLRGAVLGGVGAGGGRAGVRITREKRRHALHAKRLGQARALQNSLASADGLELRQPNLTELLGGVQREMLGRTGVRVSIAAARSEIVARTASRLRRGSGVCVVGAGEERGFLAPLPLHRLDGLGDERLGVLRASGLVTIGELQRVPKAALQAMFGVSEGLRLWRSARGMDGSARAADGLPPGTSVRHVGIAKAGAELPHSAGWRAAVRHVLGWLSF
jgi:nucleotidyltransferase/DNA polymerase involved in DNA repair